MAKFGVVIWTKEHTMSTELRKGTGIMYIVRNSHSVIVAITTDKKDAKAIASGGGIDKTQYSIEESRLK
jgi:hypothetical protein